MALGNVYNDNKNLPHYTSRKEAGIGKEEPFYKNLGHITIIPPAPIQAIAQDFLTAAVTKISGLEFEPSTGSPVEQIYRGATRSYAGGKLETTTLDLDLNFNNNLNEANQLYVYKILRAWAHLIHDPQTGRRGLKINYTGSGIIEYHNREGDIFWRATLGDIWISGGIPSIWEVDYSAGDHVNLDGIKFRCDYWVEEYA